MSAEPVLVDSNVLVYALDKESEHHGAARSLLERAQNGELALCITHQVLADCFAVVTDPRRVTRPRTAEEALSVIDQHLVMLGLTLMPIPADVVGRWVELVRQHPVTGGAIFDLQLVATMLANGVRRIYTFNREDFEYFEEIEVLTP